MRNVTTYDALASDYDSLRFGKHWGRYDFEETRAVIQDIVSTQLAACPSSYWSALDLACGTGKIAVTLGQLGGNVVALDLSPNMLQQCSARSKEAGVEGKVRFTIGSAEAIPYRTGSFDCAFSFRFFHLLPAEAYPGVLREMVRVVKPGGYIVLETKNRWYGGVMFWIKDFLRRKKGWTMFSSYMDPKKMRLLADEVEGVSLESIGGLLLPKGWLVMKYPRLRKLARVAARKHMRFIAAQLVAIYRKDAQ